MPAFFRTTALILLALAARMYGTPAIGAGPPDHALQTNVEAIAAKHHGNVTLFAEDLNTGRTIGIAPDRPVPTASVIKLAVLFEALEQIRSGKAKFDDRLTLRKKDQVAGSGVLLFLDPPAVLSLKEILKFMIILSDNTATNLAIDRLGLANIDARIRWMGLHDTYLYRRVFSNSTQHLAPARRAEERTFGLGKTTAHEMAKVMERIYRCELGEPGERAQPGDTALCGTALTMLGDQFYRDAIPRYLDGRNAAGSGSGAAVGNKSGSLDQVRNDVALVASKRGPIVISAFTFDNKDQSWQADNEAELTIAKLAKAIVEGWSPEGLAPDQFKVAEPRK